MLGSCSQVKTDPRGDRQCRKPVLEPLLIDGCSCVPHRGLQWDTSTKPRLHQVHSQCSYHTHKKCNNLSCTRLSWCSFNPNALTIDFCTTFLCRTCFPPALRGSAASLAPSPQCQQLNIVRGHREELCSSSQSNDHLGLGNRCLKWMGKHRGRCLEAAQDCEELLKWLWLLSPLSLQHCWSGFPEAIPASPISPCTGTRSPAPRCPNSRLLCCSRKKIHLKDIFSRNSKE